MIAKLTRYYHTLKYLKPVQIYGRIAWKYKRPKIKPITVAPTPRKLSGWLSPVEKTVSMVGPRRFRFLQREEQIPSATDWNRTDLPRLWLYNLHYFDDLCGPASPERATAQRELIKAWIAENPVGVGCGWEPYPVALRLVNWIKWVLAGGQADEAILCSLATQARWLTRRIEYYLQGNHLLADAKGLLFAGLFFTGDEAESWRRLGTELLSAQLQEQILPDGAHYERSAMYHSVIYEDVLDVINLKTAWGKGDDPLVTRLREIAASMGRWLRHMLHPDGQIALFNDAAHEIATSPAVLFDYAARLGAPPATATDDAVVHLEESGFVRLSRGEDVALLEIKGPGPDYIPGHAHAGTLGFEWSWNGRRVLVDTGTAGYAWDEQRKRTRSTAAHNTVTVDGADSSEVWGSHRLARRAVTREIHIDEAEDAITVTAAHYGFRRLPGVGLHRRVWIWRRGALCIRDTIEGSGEHQVCLHWHFHPHLTPPESGNGVIDQGPRMISDKKLTTRAEEVSYHPRFGEAVPARGLISSARLTLPVTLETIFTWSEA